MQATRTTEELSAPLGAITTGHLVFARGASRLTIRVESAMGHLYRARFEGKVPDVRVEGGTVTVRYRPSLHPPRGEITLTGRIPWTINAHAGMSDVVAELDDLELVSWEVSAGASKVEARLPRPKSIETGHRRVPRQREDRVAKPRLRPTRGPVRHRDRSWSEQPYGPDLRSTRTWARAVGFANAAREGE